MTYTGSIHFMTWTPRAATLVCLNLKDAAKIVGQQHRLNKSHEQETSELRTHYSWQHRRRYTLYMASSEIIKGSTKDGKIKGESF